MTQPSSINWLPRYAFFIHGKGEDKDRLQAFDIALREAGPVVHNLVTVSSILPAGCQIISREEGFSRLKYGQITFCVMARQDSNTPGEKIAASIGAGRLREKEHYGFISEYHSLGEDAETAGQQAEELAAQMLAIKLGLSSEEVASLERFHVSEAATVGQSGNWVSVLALCIFVL